MREGVDAISTPKNACPTIDLMHSMRCGPRVGNSLDPTHCYEFTATRETQTHVFDASGRRRKCLVRIEGFHSSAN